MRPLFELDRRMSTVLTNPEDKANRQRKTKRIMKTAKIDLLVALASTFHLVKHTTAMTNFSCPTGAGSTNSSTQQQILPWKWTEQQWHMNLYDITDALGTAAGFKTLGGIGTVANAIWDFTDQAFVSDNTISQIMSVVYSIVKTEIDAGTLDTINSYFDSIADELSDYQTSSYSRCDSLRSAQSWAYEAMNTMKDYTVDNPAHIFLTHWATLSHLHLSILREMHYNGTDPSVCCNRNSTGACVSPTNPNQYSSEAETYYQTYYDTFTEWLPEWYTWRMGEISYVYNSYTGSYTTADSVTGMECHDNGNDDASAAEPYAKGTAQAMKNDAVSNMLGSMDLFSSLHRLIPGNETNSRIYPSANASTPLNMYRTGIWMGPYQFNGDQVQGYNDGSIDTDTIGRVKSMYVSAFNSVDWVQMTYNYGKGKNPVKDPDNYGDTWTASSMVHNGYFNWVYLSPFTWDTYASMQVGVTDGNGTYAESISYGCKKSCGKGLNMTITENFALVGWAQRYKDGPSNTYPLSTVMTSWMPIDIVEEMYGSRRLTETTTSTRNLRGGVY